MLKHLLVYTLFSLVALDAFSQVYVSGRVISESGNEPLSFATIGFKGSSEGTVTNKNGHFVLQVPVRLAGTPMVISYLGYRTKEISPSEFGENMTIVMRESILQLDELVVLPLSPTDYIRRAVKRMPENYPTDPFAATGYYREKFVENGYFVNMTEAVFKSYYPSYQDTLRNQHQLVLHRKADDLHDVEFAERWIEKIQKKEEREAQRKDEPYEEVDPTEQIRRGFGGPENILTLDLLKGMNDNMENCLDSNAFHKYDYAFANGVNYLGRELLVIDFETKRVVEHTRQKGKIYIDLTSDAIVALEYTGEAVVPLLVKPILFAFGLSITDPTFEVKIRYQPIKGLWYPENLQWSVDLDLKKRYLFHPNDESSFFVEQMMKVTGIEINDLEEIDEDKRFRGREEMANQVFPIPGITWESINTLLPEEAL